MKIMSEQARKTFAYLASLTVVLSSVGMLFQAVLQSSSPAKAAGEDLIIMWDGSGSAPTGWTYISDSGGDLYQKMPRGASSYGGTAGSDTHTPTMSYVSEGAGATVNIDPVGTAFADGNHSHNSFSASSVTSATSLPSYSSLRFIKYNTGIPTQIPSGGIVMFDATVPTGFTRYSAQDGLFLRGDATAGSTGGASTNNHSVTYTLTAEGGAARGAIGITATRAGLSGHTHNGAGTSDSITHNPINVQVILGKANSDINLPSGAIGMFDASVSAPWTLLSGSGGVFENRYIQANSTYSTALGSATHTHANQAITSGAPGNAAAVITTPVFAASTNTHTHSVTVSYGASDNAPVYRDVIIAKYEPVYAPATRNWRWFDAENVANPNTTNGGNITTGDAMASEDTMPSNTRIAYASNAKKLRIVVGDDGGLGATDVKFWLQYSVAPTFIPAFDLADQGGTGDPFRYYNGANVSDDDAISTTRLTGSPTAGRHNEDKTTGGGAGGGSTFDPAASTNYEHEFTIQNYSADAAKQYYFRLRYCATSTASCTAATVALGSGAATPSLTTASAYDLEVAQAPGDVALGNYGLGGSGNHTYNFTASQEISFWDKRGTGVAYDVTVGSVTMTCCSDTIPGTDITWTSTTGVLNSAFASDKTSFTGNTGQTLNTTRNAYTSASSSDESRRGGFNFLPTLNFVNLESATAGLYTGTLTITII